jgi:hypothetical protein
VHGLIIIGMVAVAPFVPMLRVWPLLWMAPLVLYGLVVLCVSHRRSLLASA